MRWEETNIQVPTKIEEVVGCSAEEPWELYKDRYSTELQPSVFRLKDIQRYAEEIFSIFEPGSSVLVFGAGNSFFCNSFSKLPEKFKITALDAVVEASIGLDKDVGFHCVNVLNESIPGKYDYAFSSHTLEHFARTPLLDIVIPKIMSCINKSFVSVVPFKDAWKDESSHKCRFNIDDELVYLSSKHKLIFEDIELVVCIDKEKYDAINGTRCH